MRNYFSALRSRLRKALPMLLLLITPALSAGDADTARALERRLGIGNFHNCVIVAPADVRCWGHGQIGQLGDGRRQSSAAPVKVPGIARATAITASEHWTCVADGGAVKCWGNVDGANLADPSLARPCKAGGYDYICTDRPAILKNIGDIQNLGHTGNWLYAIDGRGRASALNITGATEDGTELQALAARDVVAVDGTRATGNAHSGCAVTRGGKVVCFNEVELYGRIEDICDAPADRAACSFEHDGQTFAVAGERVELFCDSVKSNPVASVTPMKLVCREPTRHVCEIDHPGSAAEATNIQVVLEVDGRERVYTPRLALPGGHCVRPTFAELDARPLSGLDEIRTVRITAWKGAYAIDADGNVYFWGAPSAGAALVADHADGENALPVVSVDSLKHIVQIHEGKTIGCALDSSGAVFCWSAQETLGQKSMPAKLDRAPAALALSGAAYHFCAVGENRKIYCFGENEANVLGPAAGGRSSMAPVEIPGIVLGD